VLSIFVGSVDIFVPGQDTFTEILEAIVLPELNPIFWQRLTALQHSLENDDGQLVRRTFNQFKTMSGIRGIFLKKESGLQKLSI
jgi:hypothetical protein